MSNTRGVKRSRETEAAQTLTSYIDPRLTILEESSGDSTSCSSLGSATSNSARLQTPSLTSGSASGSQSNDLDVVLKTFGEETGTPGISKQASDYLKVWRFHNSRRLPSKKHIKCLEGLTQTPGATLIRCLNDHSTPSDVSSAFVQPILSKKVKSSEVDSSYRARCLASSSRFQTRKNEAGDPGIFPCTSRCGKTFRTKGDWGRHEKSNFEEWKCDICTEVVTRKGHLQAHIKDQHNSDSKVLPQQRREFFSSTQRPCGFCSKVLDSWLAWLCHVADHFEGVLPGGPKTISDWVEKGNVQNCNIADHPRDAEQDGTANVDDAVFYWDRYNIKDQLPPDTLGSLPNGLEIDFSSPLDWIKKEGDCGQHKPKGFRIVPVVNSKAPLSALFVSPSSDARRDDDPGALSPAMAAMVVSEIRHSCTRYTTTSSGISCCCNQCAERLGLKTPGVQTTPGTVGASPAEPDDGKLEMLKEFLMEGWVGPWTPFRIRRR